MENKFNVGERVYAKEAVSDKDAFRSALIVDFFETTNVQTIINSKGEKTSDTSVEYSYLLDKQIRVISWDSDNCDIRNTFVEYELMSEVNYQRKKEFESEYSKKMNLLDTVRNKIAAMKTLNMKDADIDALREEEKKLNKELDTLDAERNSL